IKVSPQQGVVVRDMNAREISEHFQFRVALETYIVKTLAGKLAPHQVDELEANLDAQEKCVSTHNIKDSVKLDREYHLLYCKFLRNQEIERAMLALKDKIYRVANDIHTRHPERIATNFPEHRAIADAVISGDGEKASTAMEVHLENGKRWILMP
ncbi:MAG: GntR family transcriptional regulator, partial [Verrucomicrobiota bacterium]